MTLARSIEPHLPMLRRYARILSGSQAGGDAYVRVTLETLIAEPDVIDRSLPQKAGIYKLFHQVWQAIGRDEPAARTVGSAQVRAADEHLRALTPLSRQVLLLTAMEGFSAADVAQILEISVPRVEALISEAENELQEIINARVLIIEDEPVIALDIATFVEEIGHRVTAVTATRREAIAAARANPPDIVLADIQLADGSSGIDAAVDILRQVEVPVIFITAFPERLLTGTRVEPTFLITKPFVPAALRVAMCQALFFRRNAKRLEP